MNSLCLGSCRLQDLEEVQIRAKRDLTIIEHSSFRWDKCQHYALFAVIFTDFGTAESVAVKYRTIAPPGVIAAIIPAAPVRRYGASYCEVSAQFGTLARATVRQRSVALAIII